MQGFELAVCHGMEEILRQNPEIILALELTPFQMEELGYKMDELLTFLSERNFTVYELRRNGNYVLPPKEFFQRLREKQQYADLLCLPNEI